MVVGLIQFRITIDVKDHTRGGQHIEHLAFFKVSCGIQTDHTGVKVGNSSLTVFLSVVQLSEKGQTVDQFTTGSLTIWEKSIWGREGNE